MRRRDVVSSRAYKVPEGAEIYGGRFDGKVVEEATIVMPVDGIAPPGVRPSVRFTFVGGVSVEVDTSDTLNWLAPRVSTQRKEDKQ